MPCEIMSEPLSNQINIIWIYHLWVFMNIKNIEDQLVQITRLLSQPVSAEQRLTLEQATGQKLPDELCNAILHAEQLNEFKQADGLGFFWGLDAIAQQEFINQYQNKSLPYTFFFDWGVDEQFNIQGPLKNGYGFSLEYDLKGELDDPLIIKNAKSLIPFLSDENHFVLYSLGRQGVPRGLLYVTEEGFGAMVAPSLVDHIKDVILGLQQGRYSMDDNEIDLPHNWCDRVNSTTVADTLPTAEQKTHPTYPWFVRLWLRFFK